jgi:glycogen debranching enzyme
MEKTLLSPESFSGWGVRTLCSDSVRFNPMAYHNGSIWPHDNALIGLGLARYGLKGGVVRLLSALYDASLRMDLYRLPELFCGFARSRTDEGPIHYPVACSPQAWASASLLGLMRAALGIRFDAQNRTLFLDRPAMPEFLEEMRFSDLKIGGSSLDLVVHRQDGAVAARVAQRTGDVDVVVIH